jgi:hypothetical protein
MWSRKLFRRLVIAAASGVAALMVLCGSVARAHEIGTTRVSVVFRADGTYHIEIVTDAAALLEKLDASTGRLPSTETGQVRSEAALAALEETFRRRLTVAFDGREVHPSIEYSTAPPPDAASPAPATIRLAGEIPRGARDFTWTYSWTYASYALTVGSDRAEPAVTEWLEGGQASSPFPLSAAPPSSRLGAAWRYFTLGFTHIVPYGLDHVLFVLGIFLLSGRARSVLWQVSAFTVAHSITLGLSMYDRLAVSPSLVEPLIALSIAYVAIENLVLSELKSWRIALVFVFGLLHGMGFAGALREIGLPRADFLMALLTFNAGVEAGQLGVIGLAFVLVGMQWGSCAWYRRRIVVPASALIACTAIYWTLQRLSF